LEVLFNINKRNLIIITDKKLIHNKNINYTFVGEDKKEMKLPHEMIRLNKDL
jgi:hypothetical protein